MPPSALQRRDVLSLAASGAVTGLAGCSDAGHADEELPDDDPVDETGIPDDAHTEVPVQILRSAEEPVVSDADGHPVTRELLVGADPLEQLSITAVHARDAAIELIETTNFDQASIGISQFEMEACSLGVLQYVRADSTAYQFHFCRVTRAASIACETKREEYQATFVRFPRSFSDPPTGSGITIGDTCLDPPESLTMDPEVAGE